MLVGGLWDVIDFICMLQTVNMSYLFTIKEVYRAFFYGKTGLGSCYEADLIGKCLGQYYRRECSLLNKAC